LDKKSNDIENLSRKLNILISKQDVLSKEIDEIKSALEILHQEEVSDEEKTISGTEEGLAEEVTYKEKPDPVMEEQVIPPSKPVSGPPFPGLEDKKKIQSGQKEKEVYRLRLPESIQSNLEDFIGTNLINKIGIIVVIIGIGIGTKFAIDKNLISPLVRLILGYLLGSALLFFTYRLKKNYYNFSAVLCSGSMAILYFMTYAGIVYFQIISVTVAFVIMVIITLFTVYQALEYNREGLAVIGLVGAYAIPFLIGGDPENYTFLFTYIAIINFGILLVAIKKYWQPLYYIAFASTWIIYVLWWQNANFEIKAHFQYGILFSGIYFLIFYFSFLVNKVLNKRKFSIEDVILILANSFVFYGLSYVSFDTELWRDLLGLFTLMNASVHILVWVVIYFQKDRDENLLRLIFGLIITFITITIPVQFDGHWVTLLWAIEGTALFVISRTRKEYFHEYMAYPILVFAIYSLLDDWKIAFDRFGSLVYEPGYNIFFNDNFLFALLTIACLAVANYFNFHPKYPIKQDMDATFKTMIHYFLGGALILVTYYTFRFEIAIYFRQLYADSIVTVNGGAEMAVRDEDILHFKTVWISIYSMFFFSLITIANIMKIKDEDFGYLVLVINALVLLIFLLEGLYILSELRESYINPVHPDEFTPDSGNIFIRYIGIAAFAYVLVVIYWQTRQKYLKKDLKIYFNLFTSLVILWILSSELLNWLDLGAYKSSYKLGLSILWGSYSLLLIIIGIRKKLKYVRIAAIVLFGITLIKLAAYDISNMDTISKTIVLILLGILLLIISFLYNKYRKIIF